MSIKFINKVKAYSLAHGFVKTRNNFILSETQLFNIIES
jgi:hypothetical protein